ncbi:MAG: branched-chain amino acid ABC transporter permease [Bacillota bacterium]
MQFLLLQTINSIALGSLLFLLASGFSLIFGLMRITNFTHAAFYMIGSYVGFAVMSRTSSFLMAVLVATLVTPVVGYGIFRWFLFRLWGQPFSQVLLCLGFLFVIDDLLLYVFGGVPRTIALPSLLSGTVSIAGAGFPTYRLFLIALGAVVAIFLHLLVERTKIGSLIRAGVDDQETTRALGVNINRVFVTTYLLGSALAGMAGALGGPILGMEPRMCFAILPLALAVVIIGGLGSLKGAFWGSIIVGFVDNFGRAFFPDFSYFALFLPMAVILTFRPSGLFGGERMVD